MFFEHFLTADPAKTALKYGGREISYAELYRKIRSRAGWLQRHRAHYLLCHASPAENLVNFLALMYTGQRGVFAGKGMSGENTWAGAEKYHLQPLDFIPEAVDLLTEPDAPEETDVFLGILLPGKGDVLWKDYRSWFRAFPVQSEVFGVQASDRVLVTDALAYSANLNTVIHAFWLGATVVMTSLSESDRWSGLLHSEKITSLFLVPSHYRLLPENLSFPGVRSAVSAGEKLDTALAAKLLRIFPGACLTEYYGAAELGHITYLQNQEILQRPTSVGRPFPGVKIHLHHDKITVDSPYVAPGYRRRPTVADIGFIDTEGYLCLLGRGGQLFRRRALNCLAEELENVAAFPSPVIPAARPAGLLLSRELPLSRHALHLFLLRKTQYRQQALPPAQADNLPQTSTGKVNFKILAKKPVDEESWEL